MYWLASFEVIPPQKLASQRPNKLKFPNMNIENCCSCILFGFCSKNSGHFFFLFWMFLSEIASRRSAITTLSLANKKRSCSKKGTFQAPKLVFSVFPAKILSRRSRLSRTTSDLTRLIRPRPIDCDRGSEQTVKIFLMVFALFFEHRQKKVFQSDPRSSADIHPKRSPQPDVRDRGVIFRATNGGQKK